MNNTSPKIRKKRRLQELNEIVGHIKRGLDDFIVNGSGNVELRQFLLEQQSIFDEKFSNYIKLLNNIEDDKTMYSIQQDSSAMLGLAFAIGVLLGHRKQAHVISNRIRNIFQIKTKNARSIALKNKSRLVAQKKQFTIEAANDYLSNHKDDRPATINALMVQIRGDIEKKSKLIGIKPPSQTSICNYLREAKLI